MCIHGYTGTDWWCFDGARDIAQVHASTGSNFWTIFEQNIDEGKYWASALGERDCLVSNVYLVLDEHNTHCGSFNFLLSGASLALLERRCSAISIAIYRHQYRYRESLETATGSRCALALSWRNNERSWLQYQEGLQDVRKCCAIHAIRGIPSGP